MVNRENPYSSPSPGGRELEGGGEERAAWLQERGIL